MSIYPILYGHNQRTSAGAALAGTKQFTQHAYKHK